MPETTTQFPVSEDGFALPVSEVMTGRGFVTGKSGSGKSNTASVVAEELLERGLPLMIVDTDGEYHGLKERYELLHVGADEDCDRRIDGDAEDADLIADLALEEGLPVVLDVSGFLEDEDARDVIYEVVKALFVAEKRQRKPFLLFVEEAHEFVPERGGGDDLHEMLVRVAKRGRKRGLGVCAMSQRPAAVDKDYITQCDWLVWHRLTWENDTAVAERILGDDAAETVRSLADGEALVMTDWDESVERVQFRRKRTLDAGGTPDLDALETDSAGRSRLVAEYSDDDVADLPAVRDDESASDGPSPDEEPSNEAPSTASDADDSSTAGRPGSDGARAGGRSRTSGSRPSAGGDEYDPVWEVGYAVVHLYAVLAAKQRRAIDRLEGAIARVLRGGERERPIDADLEAGGPVGGGDLPMAGDGRERAADASADRVARYLSRLLFVAVYAAVVATVVLLL